MRKQRRQRKIEIFRLEDRVLFEAAGAAEAVEAVENASNPNPDRQNDISESERQEKEAQSVAKYAGPDGAAIQEPGAPVQDQGAGLTRPDAIQQDPAQKLVDGSGDFSDVPDVTQEHTSELSDFLNADFSVTTDSTLSFSDSLSSDSDTHELIVIDSDAAKDLDLDALSDKTEVLVLDNDSDAMEQLNAYLDSHDGKYDSIRFVTDGDSGADSAPDHLELNGREVSASDLDAVRDHLADGGDLSVQTALDDAAPVYTLTPDGDFELVHADDLHDAVIHPEIDETITVDASANVPVSALSNPVEKGREELVIINSNIADRDVVLSQLGGRDVLEIDPSQDALSQIQDYLDANPDTQYDAIHILTHGNDQGFYLGSTQVTDAGQMTVFTGHMAENADFMLYGCNLAATERGQALIHEIADVTGCDVAASTDMTGAAAVGGDWVLEYNVGVVETASISLNADWNYRLAAITVDGKGESDTTAVNLAEALTKAGSGGSITISTETTGATVDYNVTIIANAKVSTAIIIEGNNVTLTGANYTDVTITTGGIVNSNLTVTETFTSRGSISGSTVNVAEESIVITGGNVENSTLSASGTGSINISGGGFTDTTVINSGTGDINIGSNSKFTDSSVTHSGTGNINISGGTFTESPVTHSGAGSTTITGGEFTGSEKTGTGISISGSGALYISGGTFSGFEKAVEFSSSGTATITAGDFTRNVYGLVNNGTMSVSGAGVSFTSNHNVIDDSAATAGAGILNNASGELSVSDVTIGAMGGGNYYGLENHGSITALKDSTIQYNMMSGLRNEGSIDSINNVTLNENGLSIDEEGNSYTALGGGLYNSGTIKDFIDIQITNNHAAQGGGIYNTGEISAGVNDRSFNIYIFRNEATQGGGIYWGGGFLDTSALVYQYEDPDSRGLTGNTAHQGGGVYIASGDVLFQDFRLFENTANRVNLDAATYAGGGLYIASGAKVILDSVTVENNVVENCSNGIDTKYWQYYYNDPDLAIGDTGKTTDKGGRGGGIYSEGTLTVLHSQFNKNVVNFANSSQLPDYYAFLDTLSMGGAIYSSGTLTVYDSYIHDNTAKNGLGGGIYLGGGSATIASTEYYTGESLWQQTGTLNSMIITGNTANGSSDGTQYAAGGFGGGIYSDSSVNLTLDSVTLSGNTATLTVASSSGTSYDIGRGGGLYFGEADAYRTYSAVTSAPVLGNGVLTIDGTVRDLTNGSANVAELEMNRRTSLIFDNHAVSGSGLYINSASTVSIGNTEIYNNATTASPYFTNTNDAQNFFQNFVVSSNQKDASVDIKVEAQDISAAGKLFTSSGIGLYLGGSGATASLDGVSIYGHDVGNAFGGGIYVTGDMYGSGLVHLNLVNTTLYDNTAAYGGGVYIGENASVNILNTTVAGNAAATAGGGVYIIGSNSAVNILNSILVGNTTVDKDDNEVSNDLAAESDAPAMNDMYSLFGSVLVKNSLTLQYEQQSVDPTSCINVEAKDIFADPTLANNWQIQGAQYSKEFTDSAGKVYYYDYAYGTTHTLAISAEGAAAYKGVYTAIDLATSLMYFNTLNSQAVAAGQTSGTWMNFSTRTAATVSSDKIVSSSQNGLNRQTGANGSVSYNTYNIGAYQLTVTDVFYYDTPAQNQLDPSGETRYEAYVGFQPSDGMTASFNNTEYTYNATTRTWNNTNNSYTPVTGDTLSVEGVDYKYDGTAWVATPVTGDTLTVEGVDYTYDETAWIAAHTPGAGDTLTVNGETYQYNAETDAWTNQDDPSDTYTPKIGDTLSVEGVDYTYDGTNWTASYAPAAGTTVSVNGMDYTYDGTKWTTTHTPASGDTFGHDGTDYIYDGTNWVATYAPAAGDTFSHDDGTDYIYDGTNWVATHAPAAGDTFSHDGTVYIYDGTDWVATHAPAAGDTLSHDGTVYIYDGTDWVATHAPVAGDDTLFVNGVLYQFDGTDWVEVYSPEAGDTITMNGTDYVYNTSSHEWEVTCNPESGDQLTAADGVTYTYDGTAWTATHTLATGDQLTAADKVTYTYDGTNWTATHILAAGDQLTAADGVTYTYDGLDWTATHTPAAGDTLTANGKTYQYNAETGTWTNQDDPSDTYTPVNNDTLIADGVTYTYDGTNWTATYTPVNNDTLIADGVTYTYDGTNWTATHTPELRDTLTANGVTYTYDGTDWTATHIPVEGDTFTFNGTEESTYDGTNWVVTYTPVNNNTLTVNGVTYTYDGNAWKDSAGNEYTLQIGAQIDGTDYVYNGENWVETYAPAKGNQITGTDYVYNGENWVETYAHENGDRINVDGKLYTYSSFYGSWRSSAGDEYTPEAGDRIVGTAYVYDADISAWVNTHLPADGNMIYSSGSIFTYNAMTGTWNNVAAVYTPVANDTWIVESVTYTYDGTHWIDADNTQNPVSGDIITTADGTTYKLGIGDKLVENLPYRYYTASGEYYVRPIINTTDDTINPYDGSLSLREAILLAGENLTINYTLDPAIYGENPDAPVISEKFHFGTEIVLSEKIAAGGSLEFIIGESNVYGTAADGTSLTSSFYDSIGINKGLTDSFGNDISYRIIAGTVDPTSYNVTLPASSLLPFEYDATDDDTFQSLNLTLKVSDTVNGETGRFRVFDVISGDITLYGEGAGSLTILGGNVSNDNNPNRPASERTDESISNFGGAIRLSGADATLTLNGVTINRGIANRGGAIYVADGTLNLIGTTTINGTVAHGFASAGDNVSQVTYGDGYVYTSGYGAGIYMAGGSLVIGMDALSAEKAGEAFYASNVTISGGTAAQYGGGIYLAGDSSLLGNHSLYAYDAENRLYAPVSESFAISGNSAVSGAGLYIATTGSVSLERATISGNTLRQGVSSNFKVPTSGIPASYGGGLYVAAGSSVSLKGVTVTGNVTATYVRPGSGSNPDVPNYVVSYGGGIYAEGTVTISESNLFLSRGDAPAQDIANSSISSNTALRGGGVYLADGGTFTMSGADPGKGGDVASVSGNKATAGSYTNETSNTTGQGGGLYVSAGATANLSNVVLSGNIANSVSSGAAADNNLSGRGGAVYTAGVFSLTNTTPSSETLRISMNDNSAAYGGAVYQAGGTVSLSYLSMYENKASGVTSGSVSAPTGGALYLANGTANILNATIAGNIGDAAIYTGAGTLTLTNTTLALNTGSNWGLVNSAATVFLRNTLVIGNGNSDDNNIKGEYTYDGYSLVGTEANGYSAELIFGTNDFDSETGVIQLDQTAENPALTGGYLYRDPAGNAYDQLGKDRTETPGDGVYTIGAVIAGSVSPTSVLVNTFTDDTTSDNDLYSLREAIQDADGGDITIAFDLEALQNEMAGGAEASFILDKLPVSWTAGTVTIDGSLLASLGTVSITAGTGNTAGLFALAGTSGLVLSNFTVSGRAGASFGNDGAALSLADSSTATLTNVTVQNVVTSGNGAVSVANDSSLTLAGNTVFASNQAKNGGALYNAGSLTVSGTLEFTGNQATENGGAIYNAAGTLTVTDAVFSGNTAAGNGGAIYNAAGTLTVTGDFTSNQAENGGAIYNAAGTLTVSDSAVLQGNIATGSGGAIYNAADGTLIAMVAQFSGNHADSGSGGAIYNAGSLTVSGTEFLANESEDGGAIYNEGALQFTEGTNTVFAGNTATGNGGAIYNASSDLQLAYASFTDNKAVNGGAFYNAGQNVSITGVVFGGMSEDGTVEGNTAANGGAIYNKGTMLTVTDAVFSGNTATGDGGALYNEGALTMTGGSFTGNTAANGGAIYHKGTILTVTDAVFSGNAATANGGAIYNASTESVQFTGTLLTDNIATGNGGAFYNAGQNVSVTGVVFGGMSEDGTEEGNTAANGGAIYNAAGAVLTLDASSAFSYNKATGSGGAISNSGTLSVSASFSDNRAEQNGGAISNSGTLNVRNASFSDNRAEQNGGAIYTDTSVTVNNSVFKNNRTSGDGGAISGSGVTVNGGTFTGNHADNGSGGAISGSSLSVSNATFTRNTATNGGAISGSGVTVNGGSFTENQADNGSGGAISGSSLSVSNATFDRNTATNGGAISGSDVTVKGGTFDRNTATNGGAILANGSLSVNSNFTGNKASSNGGAIAAFGADTTISGTFTGNSATVAGGAVYLDQGGTLANITLTGNTAQDGAAGYSADGALTMNSATVTSSNAKNGSVVTSLGDKTVIRNSSLYKNTASGSVVNAPNGELFLISTTVAENSGVAGTDVVGADVSIVNSTIAEARKNDVLVQAGGDVQIANSIVVGAEAGTTVIEADGDIDGAYSLLGQVALGGTFNNEYGTVTMNQSYADVFRSNTVNGNGLISLPSGSPAMAGVWTAVDTDSASEAYGSVYYTTRPDGIWTQGYNPNNMNWNLLGAGSIGGRGNLPSSATVSVGKAGGTYPSMGASWNLAWTPDPGHGLNSDFIKPSENGVAHSIYDIYNAVSDRLYANPGYLLNFRNEVSGASRLSYDFMHEFDDRYRTMGEFSVTIGRFDLGFVPSGETHITVNVKGDVSDDFTRYTTTPYLSDGTPLIPEELKPMNSETEPPAAEGTAALPEGLEEKVMAYLGRAEIFKNDFDKALDRLLALNV